MMHMACELNVRTCASRSEITTLLIKWLTSQDKSNQVKTIHFKSIWFNASQFKSIHVTNKESQCTYAAKKVVWCDTVHDSQLAVFWAWSRTKLAVATSSVSFEQVGRWCIRLVNWTFRKWASRSEAATLLVIFISRYWLQCKRIWRL